MDLSIGSLLASLLEGMEAGRGLALGLGAAIALRPRAMEPITGIAIRAIKREAVMVVDSVMGMYFINCPTVSGQKSKGKKAARVVAVDAVMGQAMRFEASPNACLRGAPSFILRSAYSVTTMAPSTNIPTANISANNTMLFSVKPKLSMQSKEIRKDPGMAIATSKAERIPRVQSTTIMTNKVEVMTLFCRSANLTLVLMDSSLTKSKIILSGQIF